MKLYGAMFVAFFVIDIIWLGLVAKTFYQKYLGYILAPGPNWIAAIIFYLLFIAGILVFAVLPGIRAQSLTLTLAYGAFFGLVTYATYDLTNLATVKDWPLIVTIVDMIWGTVLSTIVSIAGYYAGKWFI